MVASLTVNENATGQNRLVTPKSILRVYRGIAQSGQSACFGSKMSRVQIPLSRPFNCSILYFSNINTFFGDVTHEESMYEVQRRKKISVILQRTNNHQMVIIVCVKFVNEN